MALSTFRKHGVPALFSLTLILLVGSMVLTPPEAYAYDQYLPAMAVEEKPDGDPDLPSDIEGKSFICCQTAVIDLIKFATESLTATTLLML